jgi:hypothetical protein
MRRIDTEVCILGGGPAALLAQLLLRAKGMEAFVVGASSLGSLLPLQVGAKRINAVPIFLTEGTFWHQRLIECVGTEHMAVKLDYSPTLGTHGSESIGRNSYSQFLEQNHADSNRRLIITKKQLGPRAFVDDYPALRRKVAAHYPSEGKRPSRIGFVDGLSPYLSLLEEANAGVTLTEDVSRIDVDGRLVETPSTSVSYRYLVSTLPLARFLRLSHIDAELVCFGAGAQILVSRSPESFQSNYVIYVCDGSSSVHRVFTPHNDIAITQVSHPSWGASTSSILERTRYLLNVDAKLESIQRFAMQDCYPLGVSDEFLLEEIVRHLETLNVTLFGRFGEWVYKDLEELDWGKIQTLA